MPVKRAERVEVPFDLETYESLRDQGKKRSSIADDFDITLQQLDKYLNALRQRELKDPEKRANRNRNRELITDRSGKVIIGKYEVDFDRIKKGEIGEYYAWTKNRVTGKENWMRYTSIRRVEKSGAKQDVQEKRFKASVTIGKRQIDIGYYETKEQAREAERNAMQALYPGRVS